MKNELAGIKPRNGNFIMNLESSTEENGTHWFKLTVESSNSFYFDSFGVVPPTEVIQFCKFNTRLFSERSQDYYAETCGFFYLG